MSIMPLGNSSADRPGRQYQDKLNARAKLPKLISDAGENPELAACGWFSAFWGPAGCCPVQLMGILKNGEAVYFRARGKRVELEVGKDFDSVPHARYIKLLDVTDEELGTGVLPLAICVEYIKRWFAGYISLCGSVETPYCGKSFKVNEPEESISLHEQKS